MFHRSLKCPQFSLILTQSKNCWLLLWLLHFLRTISLKVYCRCFQRSHGEAVTKWVLQKCCVSPFLIFPLGYQLETHTTAWKGGLLLRISLQLWKLVCSVVKRPVSSLWICSQIQKAEVLFGELYTPILCLRCHMLFILWSSWSWKCLLMC